MVEWLGREVAESYDNQENPDMKPDIRDHSREGWPNEGKETYLTYAKGKPKMVSNTEPMLVLQRLYLLLYSGEQ
jgi:hypothetical protein